VRTQSEPTPPDGDDRTGETTLDVAEPPPRPAAAGPQPPSTVGSGRTDGAAGAPPPRPRGHVSRTFLLALGATMIAAGVLCAAATVALSVPWLWPRLWAAARHHPDTVLATVMLAASLAAVWRMSGPREPGGH
jgi:hypothetical protein